VKASWNWSSEAAKVAGSIVENVQVLFFWFFNLVIYKCKIYGKRSTKVLTINKKKKSKQKKKEIHKTTGSNNSVSLRVLIS
jgi:uncharacterized membrane protein